MMKMEEDSDRKKLGSYVSDVVVFSIRLKSEDAQT